RLRSAGGAGMRVEPSDPPPDPALLEEPPQPAEPRRACRRRGPVERPIEERGAGHPSLVDAGTEHRRHEVVVDAEESIDRADERERRGEAVLVDQDEELPAGKQPE